VNIKNIAYTALLAGFFVSGPQINAFIPRDPQEALRELGRTPGMQTREAIEKELSIIDAKQKNLKNALDQAREQHDKDQVALNNCYDQYDKEAKKLYPFQHCKTDCSALAINYCGHSVDNKYWSNPYPKDIGGSYGEHIQAQKKHSKASADYENFKKQNSACRNIDCFNNLLKELQKWNQEN